MLGQVGAVGEALGAVRTLVWLCLRMGLGVDLHLRLGVEGQRTHPAPLIRHQRIHTGESRWKPGIISSAAHGTTC